MGEIIDIGVDKGIINPGSWFSYDETKLGQGRDSVKSNFAENPDLAQEIEDKIISVLKEEVDNFRFLRFCYKEISSVYN